MDIIWNKERILDLLQCFYTLIPARVSFFGVDGEELLAYPTSNTDYCDTICSTPKGEAACQVCDRTACQYVKDHKAPYTYRCHAGLTEVIAPIIAYGEQTLGYLMIGQLCPDDGTRPELEKIWQNVGGKNADFFRLERAYETLMFMDTQKITSCMRILQACAASVWMDDYIHISNESLSKQIERYIYSNMEKPLSLSELIAHFQIGRTTLCQTIRNELGVSVNRLVRNIRIKEAKTLLQSGNMPVREIAERIGIPDYNYFTKVFKDETGLTPTAFRKKNKE